MCLSNFLRILRERFFPALILLFCNFEVTFCSFKRSQTSSSLQFKSIIFDEFDEGILFPTPGTGITLASVEARAGLALPRPYSGPPG